MRFGIGQPVTRKEDARFLTGRGRYVADLDFARQAHAVFLYAPHAHARIRAIDKAAAEQMPGVFAVLTGEDWARDGLGTLDPEVMAEDMGGPKGYRTQRPPLAIDRVRYVGERVAVVIAATEAQARDAAELISVDYEVLPAVISAADAVRAGAPLIHEGAANNTSFMMRMGNADAVDAGFARAHHITRLSLHNNRVTAVTMEPRGCIGDYDPGTRRYTLYSSTQNVHGARQILAHQILHVPERLIRVVARDVGGGFGMKGNVYPEEAVVVWAARRVGRPVKWIPSRSEALLGDAEGRDQNVNAELALDVDGKFLALRWTGSHNVGAYIEGAGAIPIIFSVKLASTVYDIRAVAVTSSLIFTNTAPTVPYRGAGRPEAVYLMERLVDRAAREMHIDPAELRKKNLIRPDTFPYETRTGWTYDTGNYAAAMAKCQALADWDGYPARRALSAAASKYSGRGITYYVDNTGVFNERMELRFDPSGELTILAGTLSHGQGHETSYAQMVADWLGMPEDKIHLTQADTDEIAIGRGTYASRSMMIGGSALRAAADEVIERGKRFAAHFMEADAADIAFADGAFTIAGTDRSMPIAQVAQMSFIPVGLPSELGVGLQGAGAFSSDVPSFPNGCHICEVEIDPDTGAVALDRYTVVDDIGTVINPLLAKGQIHGGVAQGAGQALVEDIVYDRDNGQLLTGSLIDYGIPRADTMPAITVDFSPVPSTTNPLGAKGVGEGGTVASTPTVMNAILDALAPLGITDLPMPATPERTWRAIREHVQDEMRPASADELANIWVEHQSASNISAFSRDEAAGTQWGTLQSTRIENDAGQQGDHVDCSVFARPEVRAAQPFDVHVLMHRRDDLVKAVRLALSRDEDANRRGFSSLATRIPLGATVELFVESNSFIIRNPLQNVIWDGSPTCARFTFELPSDPDEAAPTSQLYVSFNGILIGELAFTIRIASALLKENSSTAASAAGLDDGATARGNEDRAIPLGVSSVTYDRAFISYSRRDFEQASLFAQGLEERRIQLCMDVTTFEPGDDWAEQIDENIRKAHVFYLIWSKNAATSFSSAFTSTRPGWPNGPPRNLPSSDENRSRDRTETAKVTLPL